MPSRSPAQARLMRAVAAGWTPSDIEGPPRSVAQEFAEADKRRAAQLGSLAKAYGPSKRPKRSV